MSKIVLEDFNEGDGYYKVNLAYLNKEQVEEIESLISKWNPTDEDFIDCIGMCLTDVNEQRFKDYGTNLRDCLAWLEKQCEKKQDPCDNCKDVMLNCHNFPCIKKRAFKQGKSAIEVINEEQVDNANFHLWTIQDAKDGDVLNSPSHHLIWIYKDNEHFYACVNMNYVTKNVATKGSIKIPSDACPATKEQRDTLMKAMADAGYTFDFAKKELKKIEQKLYVADKVEPKFKVKYAGSEYNVLEVKDVAGVAFYGIEDEPNHIDYVKAENCKIISGYVIKENGSLYPTKSAVFSEQKPAWSYEDEANLNNIIWLCNNCIKGPETTWIPSQATKIKHLMETIKEKGLVQQNTAWSEEDERQWNNIYDVLDGHFELSEEGYKNAANWFKAIKGRVQPQPKQKWSEEEETRVESLYGWLDTLINYIHHDSVVSLDLRRERMQQVEQLKTWLKSLRPQNTWNPSDEQIKAFEHFVKSIGESGYASPYENNTKLLYSLLEQLKKLK